MRRLRARVRSVWRALWRSDQLDAAMNEVLGAGLVDGVDAGIIPVLLGGGIPLLPSPAERTRLTLRNRRVYEKSGIVGVEYDVVRD